jgi:hypothetical protein
VSNSRNFGCFIENRGGDCRIEKVSKMKIPCTPCTLFKFRGGIFGVFRTFNLESGKISEKGVFDVFWKNFHFCVLPAGGRRPLWGENLNFAFFRKVRNTFSVLGPILLLLYSRKSVRTKMTTPTDYLYTVAQGVSFPYAFFVQIPGCEMASKKKWTVLQYYYIGYESRGGRCTPDYRFRKTRFPRF